MVTLDHIVVRSTDVLSQNLDGEAVLLDLASEAYFGLNAVGSKIWELLEQSQPLRNVLVQLQEEYGVEAERLQADLLELVRQLMDAGLVQVK